MVFDHLQDLATCTQGYGEKIIALDVQLTNTKEQLAAGTAVPVPACSMEKGLSSLTQSTMWTCNTCMRHATRENEVFTCTRLTRWPRTLIHAMYS